MNSTYLQYRTDECFRDAIAAAVRRQRARAVARLLSSALKMFQGFERFKGFKNREPRHAARTHLARQG